MAKMGTKEAPAHKLDAALVTNILDMADFIEDSQDRWLLEPYDEPVVIEVVMSYRDPDNPETPEHVTPETATLIKLLKQDLNIDIKYQWITSLDLYDAKFAAEMAVGQLPDLVTLNPTQFQELYEQGKILDLTNLYDTYSNDLLRSIYNNGGRGIEMGMRDGRLYGLPNARHAGQGLGLMYYRMDILEKVGIDTLPTTIEDFEHLCDRLMVTDWDGDGEIGEPIIAASRTYDHELAGLMPFFMAYSTTVDGWYPDDHGRLVYGGIDRALMKPLAKLNEFYEKGYIDRDFAAQEAYAGVDQSVVDGIIDGEFPIVCGTWWIPNWPLNYSVNENPKAKWVIGPTLSATGDLPEIYVDRYPVETLMAITKDCEHPEAVFKILHYTALYESHMDNPAYRLEGNAAYEAAYNGYVQNWLPWEVFSPSTLGDNYRAINRWVRKGTPETLPPPEDIQTNTEFWKSWNAYQEFTEDPTDGGSWGMYFSRVAPEGGVAKMTQLYEQATKHYNEAYIPTKTMLTSGEVLGRYQQSVFLAMMMGDMPVSDFPTYVARWRDLGGRAIEKEVNLWYLDNKPGGERYE